MNPIGLYIVCGLLIIMILYIIGGIIWDHRRDIKDILAVRKHYHKKDALLIDYWRVDKALGPYPGNWMDDTRRWYPKGASIEEPYEEVYRMGYDRAEKWMSELRYLGIPIFVRLHNFTIIDPATMDEERFGPRNRVTSSIMHNVYKARTGKRFVDHIMAKVKFAEMDVKTLGLIIPIVLGLCIGVAYFMTGGF